MCRKVILSTIAWLALWLAPSCMKNIPDTVPEHLEWNPELAMPLGEDRFGLNSESGFDTLLLENDALTGLPGWLGLNVVVMQKISDLDLGPVRQNLDHLNRVLFRINSSNQFPHPMHLQAYFLDQAGSPVDSLFREGPADVPAGTVSDTGEAVDPGLARHDAVIEAERIALLSDSRSLLLRAFFKVEDVEPALLTFYPDFHYDLHSGWMLDLSLEY